MFFLFFLYTLLYMIQKTPLIITCQAGLESLVKRDAEKLGAKILSTQDRIVRVE